jgi:hypothetical protein
MNLSEEDFFSGLFEPRPVQVVGVVMSFVSSGVYIPMFYSIIWFERCNPEFLKLNIKLWSGNGKI